MITKEEIKKMEEFWDLELNKQSLTPLSGGDINKCYSVNTSSGKCVIKLINVGQYTRDYHISKNELLQSLSFVENVAKNQNGNVIYAIEGNGGLFLEEKKKIFALYPYRSGFVVTNDQIDMDFVRLIANKLYEIHHLKIDYDKEYSQYKSSIYHEIAKELVLKKWWNIINKFSQITPFFPRLKTVTGFLLNNQDLFFQSINESNRNTLCHNDLKPKNVLWAKDNTHYWILDWEAAADFDSRVDYLDTLIAWCAEGSKAKLFLNADKARLFQDTYPMAREELILSVYLVILKWCFWLCFCLGKCIRQPVLCSHYFPLVKEAMAYLELIINHRELTVLR